MKKGHLLIFVIFVLLALILVLGRSRFVIYSQAPKIPVKSGSLKLIDERIHQEKSKSISPSPEESIKKSCWEKIREQYQTNPDYLTEYRHRLNDVVGEWYYTRTNPRSVEDLQENSIQGQFFLALAKAGLLEGFKTEQDDESALLLLEQIAAADPQNSAPLLYAAIIQKRRGNQERTKELLKFTERTTYFDSYLKDFTHALFEGVRTPSDLLAAQEAWSKTPVPDYTSIRILIQESKRVDIAKQLIQDGLQFDRKGITDLHWVPVEYAVGKKLLDFLDGKTKIPEYHTLIHRSPNTLSEIAERAVSKLDATCNLEAIENEVDLIRESLEVF